MSGLGSKRRRFVCAQLLPQYSETDIRFQRNKSGATSLSRSSHLLVIDASNRPNPVIFRPGRIDPAVPELRLVVERIQDAWRVVERIQDAWRVSLACASADADRDWPAVGEGARGSMAGRTGNRAVTREPAIEDTRLFALRHRRGRARAVRPPRFGGAKSCERLRQSVWISRSRSFRFMALTRKATWSSAGSPRQSARTYRPLQNLARLRQSSRSDCRAPCAKIGYTVVAAKQPFRHAKVARNGQEKAETR